MNLPRLALRNTFRRNLVRSLLTMGGVMVLTLAFIFLRTVISAFTTMTEDTKVDRMVVRNRISLTFTLPLAYLDKIKAVPGIDAVTYSNWFGGVYIDQRHFFAKMAIDPDDYFKVYTDVAIDPTDLAAFRADRTGCLIGEGLAKQYGFKKGDVIKVKGDIYPGDWSFKVEGVFQTTNAFADRSLFFQWKYLDSGQPEARRGQIGTFTFHVSNSDRSPEIARQVDALFQSSAHETHTESEQAFVLGFITGSQAIVGALQAVSFVMLFIMLLILGNTLAMSLRERTGELAVLRTLGFRPGQLVELTLAEGVWLALCGGVLGMLLSRPVIQGFARQTSGMVNIRHLDRWALPALGLALAMGLLASLLPAVQAARIDIIQALRRVE